MLVARNLSRVVFVLGTTGLLTLALVVVVALDASVLHAPPIALRLLAGVGGAALVALTLRALRTAVRLLAEARCAEAALRGLPPSWVGGLRVVVIADERLVACCVGWVRPDVVVSTGAIAALDERQLRAVLAHEAAHAARRDPLRLLAAAVAVEALGFLPGARRLGRRYAELLEVAADQQAVLAVGRAELAAALVVFADHSGAEATAGRVDSLLGEPVRTSKSDLAADGALLVVLAALSAAMASSTGCLDVLRGTASFGGEEAVPALGALLAAAAVALAVCAAASKNRFRNEAPS